MEKEAIMGLDYEQLEARKAELEAGDLDDNI